MSQVLGIANYIVFNIATKLAACENWEKRIAIKITWNIA